MKLFISWSGERSEALAKALHEWLKLVLHFAQPWLSKSDIQAGERWSIEVAKELGDTNFGILCITQENIHSDWILFEAGALAKSMQDGRVIPLLLDLDFKDISGPLAQFQSKKVDKVGIRELVGSLNKAWSQPVPDGQLDALFESLWPRFEAAIAAIPIPKAPAKHARPQGEILEELVSGIRSVEMRVREAMDEDFSPHRRRKPRMRSMMLLETASGLSPGDPLRLLAYASHFRDDVPWIYELARETYDAISRRVNPRAIRRNAQRLLEALEGVRRGPLIDNEFSDRAFHHLLDEVQRLIEWSESERVLERPASLRDITAEDQPKE